MFAPWDILALSFVISYDPYVWLPYQFILAGAADLSEKAGEETIKCSFAWLVILHDQNFGSWIRQEMIISIDRWLWLCLALPDTEFKDSLRYSVFNTWFLNVDDNVHCTLFNDCIDYFSLQGAKWSDENRACFLMGWTDIRYYWYVWHCLCTAHSAYFPVERINVVVSYLLHFDRGLVSGCGPPLELDTEVCTNLSKVMLSWGFNNYWILLMIFVRKYDCQKLNSFGR